MRKPSLVILEQSRQTVGFLPARSIINCTFRLRNQHKLSAKIFGEYGWKTINIFNLEEFGRFPVRISLEIDGNTLINESFQMLLTDGITKSFKIPFEDECVRLLVEKFPWFRIHIAIDDYTIYDAGLIKSENISMSGDLRDFKQLNNFYGSVGNVAGNVQSDQKSIQNVYLPEQKQKLSEAVKEIQELLKQLEQTNPIATDAEKVSYVNGETTPNFKRRAVAALEATGEAAIDEFILDNKYLKIVKAAIKGWVKPE